MTDHDRALAYLTGALTGGTIPDNVGRKFTPDGQPLTYRGNTIICHVGSVSDAFASIAPAWRRAWQEVIPFFAFDPAIRKIIYTTNAIESLNRVIRKSIETRGSFPTEEAATKLIYLAIRNFEKGGRNVREWFAARNQFAIMFDERFNA